MNYYQDKATGPFHLVFSPTEIPRIIKLVNAALLNTIKAHGDITSKNYQSASKRIAGDLRGFTKSMTRAEKNRQREHRAMMLFE